MKYSHRGPLTVEMLESRDCPSVSAQVIGGNLVVFAFNSNTLLIEQLDADSFRITENGTTVLQRDGVTGSMAVNNLGFNSANVTIDFNANATIKNVSNTFLTLGTNSLTMVDGTITGSLFANGGLRGDTVNLGDGVSALVVNGLTSVNLFTGTDTLDVNPLVTLNGNLATTLIENVTLDAGSVLAKNATFFAGLGGNTYNLNGAVTGNVWYTGGLGSDTFNTGATSTIGGDLALFLLGGNDNVSLGGAVSNNLSVNSAVFGGVKTVNLGGTVGNNANVNLGFGNDIVNFTGIITGTFTLNTGFGNDKATFANGSNATTVSVNLGPGNDVFNLGLTALVGGGTVNGGIGTDTFNGTGSGSFGVLNVINFEIFTL